MVKKSQTSMQRSREKLEAADAEHLKQVARVEELQDKIAQGKQREEQLQEQLRECMDAEQEAADFESSLNMAAQTLMSERSIEHKKVREASICPDSYSHPFGLYYLTPLHHHHHHHHHHTHTNTRARARFICCRSLSG